jgi:hypothetical protein
MVIVLETERVGTVVGVVINVQQTVDPASLVLPTRLKLSRVISSVHHAQVDQPPRQEQQLVPVRVCLVTQAIQDRTARVLPVSWGQLVPVLTDNL